MVTRGTNQDVVESWIQGEAMQHMSGKLSTDGKVLKSYSLVIGMTDENREKVVGNYTANGGDFYSQTTSEHVGRAIRTLENVWEIHKNQNSEFNFRVLAPSEMAKEKNDG